MSKLSIFLLMFILTIALLPNPAFSNEQIDYVIINQIQIAGIDSTKDEFVELYNPTDQDINLENYRLSRKTKSGSQYNLLTKFPNVIIKAQGYFLIAHPETYTYETEPDEIYSTSTSISDDNTIILYSDQGDTIIDLVGLGEAGEFETISAQNPAKGQSLKRINYQDTDDNSVDFEIINSPQPKNSQFQQEDGDQEDENQEEEPISEPEQDPEPEEENIIPYSRFTPGTIVINEIVADPADEGEWIELFNKSQMETSLEGWTLEEGSEKVTKLNGKIGAFQELRYVVFNKSSLNNSGDVILLKDAEGNIIDRVAYGNWDDNNLSDNAPVAKDPHSIARKQDGYDTDNDSNDFIICTTPTKQAPNVCHQEKNTEIIYQKGVIINEILPNPAGSDSKTEWIELKNITDQEIDIAGWKIGDSAKKKYTISKDDINTIVKPKRFLVLERSITGIALNNSGEEKVKLYFPNDELANEIIYSGSVKEETSYALYDNEWSWTTTPTKETENSITQINNSPIAIIDCPKTANINEEILFDASDSSDPDNDSLTYEWEIENETKSTDVSFNYIFEIEGKFIITLTINDGVSTATDKATIQIINPDNISENNTSSKEEKKPTNNVSEINYDYSENIYISEILPNPEGDDASNEFIEICSADENIINLKGWQIDDQEGGSNPYEILEDLYINPNEFLILKREQTGIALNNSNDSARLINPDGLVIDKIDYEKSTEGSSLAFSENEWGWTSTITPGKENVFTHVEEKSSEKNSSENKPTISVELKDIREQKIGTKVITQGIVAVEPGILGSQIFYLKGSGIQVYMYKKDFPDLKTGDLIQVVGELSESSGEMRIKLSQKEDINIIKQNNSQPEPKPIIATEFGEENEGYLVTVTGTVIEKRGSGFYLDDGSGEEVYVYIKNTTNINTKLEEGQKVQITGIIGQTKSGYRLMPRYDSDIEIINDQVITPINEQITVEPNKKRQQVINYLLINIAILFLGFGGWIIKNKKLNKQETQ